MEPRQILATLRAGWWLPLVGLVLGAGIALGITVLQTPVYASSTQFFVSSGSTTGNQAVQANQLATQRAAAYARLLEGQGIAERVVQKLNLDLSPAELRREISATADTVLLDVTVSDPSAQRAASIIEALGEEFPAYVSDLEPQSSGADKPRVDLKLTGPPEAAGRVSPDPVRNIGLGAVAGLFLGLVIPLVRARLDRSVKDLEQMAALVGAPVVGTVLQDDKLGKDRVLERGAASRTAEDFRQLRNNLQWLDVDNPPRAILVTSALPAEGKTTTVVNLALTLADGGRRVAVVEADLRKPKVTEYLGVVGDAGLTNVLSGAVSLSEVLQRYGDLDLWVVAAGPKPPNPGEVLASSQMGALVEKLRGEYDYVLVDAPPVLPVADASGLAVHMDGVLLTVRYGGGTPEQLRQTAEVLERVRAKTLGVIVTAVPAKSDIAGGRGYGYAYA